MAMGDHGGGDNGDDDDDEFGFGDDDADLAMLLDVIDSQQHQQRHTVPLNTHGNSNTHTNNNINNNNNNTSSAAVLQANRSTSNAETTSAAGQSNGTLHASKAPDKTNPKAGKTRQTTLFESMNRNHPSSHLHNTHANPQLASLYNNSNNRNIINSNNSTNHLNNYNNSNHVNTQLVQNQQQNTSLHYARAKANHAALPVNPFFPSHIQQQQTPKTPSHPLPSLPDIIAKHNSASFLHVNRNSSYTDDSMQPLLHPIDPNTIHDWVYPTNRPIRDYQFNIISSALFSNTLVALPTGLGKTFIAAVIMYNYYRWFPESKIVFMAPTKPLVAQQIEACYSITGLPQSDTDELTGAANPELRRESWNKKRVFFLTPQVLQNDLNRDTCPAYKICLVVVDEAHRALGRQAYCEVIRLLQSHTPHTRILALTATPGADIKTVQSVITNLHISNISIRTEDSLDIRPYTHKRVLDVRVIPPSPQLKLLSTRLSDIISPFLQRLNHSKLTSERDPKNITRYGLMLSRDRWRASCKGTASPGYASTIEFDLGVCMSLCEALHLLHVWGIKSLQRSLKLYEEESLKGKAGKRVELVKSVAWRELMGGIERALEGGSVSGHPKLGVLVDVVVEHFRGFVESGGETRVMIFSQYRDSVEEIVDALKVHSPLVRVMSFVGQTSGKKTGSKGFTQKDQLEVISKFQSGNYNVLVATCIGEEGLDIGDVDLIVCYDTQNSPIRMLQRMGRTGRKRQGRVVLLLSEGREEDAHRRSQAQYKTVQKAIMEGQGKKLTMFDGTRTILLPKSIPKPTCTQTEFVIPDYDINKKTVGGRRVGGQNESKEKASHASASSSSSMSSKRIVEPGHYLTASEREEYERKFTSLGHSAIFRAYPDLSTYSHWQSILLPTSQIETIPRTRKFVETVELLQQLADEEEVKRYGAFGVLMKRSLRREDREKIDSLKSDRDGSLMDFNGPSFIIRRGYEHLSHSNSSSSAVVDIEIIPNSDHEDVEMEIDLVDREDSEHPAIRNNQSISLDNTTLQENQYQSRNHHQTQSYSQSNEQDKESMYKTPHKVSAHLNDSVDDDEDNFDELFDDSVLNDISFHDHMDISYKQKTSLEASNEQEQSSKKYELDDEKPYENSYTDTIAPVRFNDDDEDGDVAVLKDVEPETITNDTITMKSISSTDAVQTKFHIVESPSWATDIFCRLKGASMIPQEFAVWPTHLFGLEEALCSDNAVDTKKKVESPRSNLMRPPSSTFKLTPILKKQSHITIASPLLNQHLGISLTQPPVLSSPMQSQMPIRFGVRSKPLRKTILLDGSEDQNSMQSPHPPASSSPPRKKSNELECMFDDDDENVMNQDPGLQDDHDSNDDSIHHPTPIATKLLRRRLEKKPRKPPRIRGTPIVNEKEKSNPNSSKHTKKASKKKKRRLVSDRDVAQFCDVEAELSDEVSDSGDEIVDGDIDVDLEGFVVGDEASVSYENTPATTPGGIAMYQRSLLSPSGGLGYESRRMNQMLNKYRDKLVRGKNREREEWEGIATQYGEGAEASEYYDDEELADFVVDDDEIEEDNFESDDDSLECEDSSLDEKSLSSQSQADEHQSSKASKGSKVDHAKGKERIFYDESKSHNTTHNKNESDIPSIAKTTRLEKSVYKNDKSSDLDHTSIPNISNKTPKTPLTTILSKHMKNKASSESSPFDVNGPTPIKDVTNLTRKQKDTLFYEAKNNSHVEKVYQKVEMQTVILADNREISSGVCSILKTEYKLRVEFRQLIVGDYIISQRVAVERKSKSDLLQSTFNKRIYDQLNALSKMYEMTILLVEFDNVKESLAYRSQIEGIVAGFIRTKTKVMFSYSREDTARILYELAEMESGQASIEVPVTASNKDMGAIPFLMSIPGISDATCLNIVNNGKFENLNQFLTSDSDVLMEKIPNLRRARAKEIEEFGRRKYDHDACLGITTSDS